MQAKQIGNWQAEPIMSYQGLTPNLKEMAEQVTKFRADVVVEA